MDMSAPAIRFDLPERPRVRPLMPEPVVRDIETIVSDDDRAAV
jgi:hypothetical protein